MTETTGFNPHGTTILAVRRDKAPSPSAATAR